MSAALPRHILYRDQTWFSCINIRQVPREVLKTEGPRFSTPSKGPGEC